MRLIFIRWVILMLVLVMGALLLKPKTVQASDRPALEAGRSQILEQIVGVYERIESDEDSIKRMQGAVRVYDSLINAVRIEEQKAKEGKVKDENTKGDVEK